MIPSASPFCHCTFDNPQLAQEGNGSFVMAQTPNVEWPKAMPLSGGSGLCVTYG